MAGHLQRALQLIHPVGEFNALAQMAKALRRKFPSVPAVRDTIWDLDVLLVHLQANYADNAALSDEKLMHKAMLLIMIFGMSRPGEIARMGVPPPGDVGESEARLRVAPKQRGTELTPVILRKASIAALCPLAALTEWLRRRPVAARLLFSKRVGGRLASDGVGALAPAHGGPAPAGGVATPPRTPGRAQKAKPTEVAPPPARYADLQTRDVSAAFHIIMREAGIPDRYPAYSIRHAAVTALFMRGANDEEVAAFGRWARGSRVPRLFYFIHATDGTWMGERLLREQPALKDEFLRLRGTERSGAEAGDEPSETDSSPAGDAQ
jgi:hypothetical protein